MSPEFSQIQTCQPEKMKMSTLARGFIREARAKWFVNFVMQVPLKNKNYPSKGRHDHLTYSHVWLWAYSKRKKINRRILENLGKFSIGKLSGQKNQIYLYNLF